MVQGLSAGNGKQPEQSRTAQSDLLEFRDLREIVLDTGEVASKILIDRGRIGSIAEMGLQTQNASIVLGSYGYLGLIDYATKKIYNFGDGSAACKAGFSEIYVPFERLGFTHVQIQNTRMFGRGDDSEVIELLENYGAAQSVKSAIEGKYAPEACLRKDKMTDREWGARQMLRSAEESQNPLAKGLCRVAAAGELGFIRSTGSDVGTALDWNERLQRAKALNLL